MRIPWLWVVIFIYMGAWPARAQSLADVAKQERERQAKADASNTPSKKTVYTNADLYNSKNTGQVTAGQLSDSRPNPKAGTRSSAHSGSWRNRLARADEKIRALELKVDYYASRIKESNPSFATAKRSGKRTRARPARSTDWEQQKAKAERDLQLAREAKQRIEEDARKAGVLPGHLR